MATRDDAAAWSEEFSALMGRVGPRFGRCLRQFGRLTQEEHDGKRLASVLHRALERDRAVRRNGHDDGDDELMNIGVPFGRASA